MPRRFRSSSYGPMHLRAFLRARLELGERVVGFAAGQLSPSPARVLAHVALSLVPGFGHLLSAAHSAAQGDGRRIVLLTSRRILLLRPDRTGPDPTGRGIAAELPLSLLEVGYDPPPVALAARSTPRRRIGQRRARLRRTQIAREVAVFTLTDLRHGARVQLALDRSGGGAQRLREALVLLADEPVSPASEPQGEQTGGAAGMLVGGAGVADAQGRGGKGGRPGRRGRAGAVPPARQHPRAAQGRTQE